MPQTFHDLVFATLALPGESESAAVLLAASLRHFGGALSQTPLWVLVPNGAPAFSAAARERLDRLQVQYLPFSPDSKVGGFPFAAKVQAAARAEALVAAQASLLAWMDADTLFIQEPAEFFLPDGKQLGCCPVHHRLIGSPWGQPVDDFWGKIYQACDVSKERLFPVTPVLDEGRIWAYFNAGLLVVRPEQGLLQAWEARFFSLFCRPEFELFFRQDPLYRIFFHQAVLAGVLLSRLVPQELHLFSDGYNYPLHLYEGQASSRRPAAVDQLITCRYETFFQEPDWFRRLPASPALVHWINELLVEA